MSEQPPQYEVGQVVNGYSWNGVGWDPVASDAAPVEHGLPGSRVRVATRVRDDTAVPGGRSGCPATRVRRRPRRSHAGPRGRHPVLARRTGRRRRHGRRLHRAPLVERRHLLVRRLRITFALWRRAWAKYQATSYATGQGLSTNARLLLAAGGLIAVVPAAFLGVAWAGDQGSQSQLTETVGSCWAEDGSQVVLVACSDSRAQYVAVQQVSTGSEETSCPSSSARQRGHRRRHDHAMPAA